MPWRGSIPLGIARREIKADTNPAEVAVILISLIEGAFMQAKVTGRTAELKIAMDYLEKNDNRFEGLIFLH
ncbi:TetR family transcriptional regulator C-terminal domain-containing protein [Paraflavitalea speifideaquila]|uniref:TetR family transcriptional regulator C-terminal domain-containing protein n=1 Tax=Paraflavitalea speifideaquila TaxID=3076558 RepID=UPI0028E45C74|nr:hypothetical protein [Paraflavitalea speifideiaquila]